MLRYGAVQAPLTSKEKALVSEVWSELKKRDELLGLVNERLLGMTLKTART